LRFVQKPNKDAAPLRDGAVDLETGVIEATTAPELCRQMMFRDRLVGVVSKGHPLAKGKITAARYAGGKHMDDCKPPTNAPVPVGILIPTLYIGRQLARAWIGWLEFRA
jgi:DNA-binding transcriptional LysR family regulator